MTVTSKLIKTRREQLGISQGFIAEKLNSTAVFISRLENGQCSCPADKIKALAQALKLPKSTLIRAINKDHLSKLEKRAE